MLDHGARVTNVIYRIWCQDGPRHDAVPHHRLPALVASGHLDLEDRVAPQGTEAWVPAWRMEGLFEPEVVRAMERHHAVCGRMARTMGGGWLSLVEYRAERDRMLEREPGVTDSAWAARPRPDLARAGATPELRRAADEGAAAERAAEQARLRARVDGTEHPSDQRQALAETGSASPQAPLDAAPSMATLRRNMERLLDGDMSGALDPMRVVRAWRDHGLRDFTMAVLAALALDPLQPLWSAQGWWLVTLTVATAGCLLLQFASSGRMQAWADRFAFCLLACVATAVLLVAGAAVDVQRGLVAHWWPAAAAWQDAVRSARGG